MTPGRIVGLVMAMVIFGTGAADGAAATAQTTSDPPAVEIHKLNEATFDPKPDQPFFALIVGNDNRAGVGGARGDAIHLVGINPATGQGTMLNIPRDTYVNVPGRGNEKINSAYMFGGPRLQADAVGGLVGVHVQFVIATNFAGFTGMVDELGGIDIDVPIPMDDQNSGAVFAPGPNHMNGGQALAFSRNRHIPGGDIKRSEHQGLLILYALAKARGEVKSPFDTMRFLGVLVRHTVLDGIGVAELYRMGRLALSLDPANVRNVTMPSRIGSAGAASVVFPAADAPGLFADFADDAVLQTH